MQNIFDISDQILFFLKNSTDIDFDENNIFMIVENFLDRENIFLADDDKHDLMKYLKDKIFGLGPIEILIDDKDISEIMINDKENIFIEKNGKITKTNITFESEAHLLSVIQKIVGSSGRRIDESSPMVDSRLQDGSRINAIIRPVSINGPALTIRKFPSEKFTFEKLIEFGSADTSIYEILKQCVENKWNIFISGGTGSGKTSMLNALGNLIPSYERLITIEDSAEIKIDHDNLVRLEARNRNVEDKGEVTIRDLVKNSLRMRPDRIIIGEIRGFEAIDMLQAMNTGHRGSMTTIHSNTPYEALLRLETMYMMGGLKIPLPVIRSQINEAIDIVIQIQRFSNGKRKISSITEIQKESFDGKYVLKDWFFYDEKLDAFEKTKNIPINIKKYY